MPRKPPIIPVKHDFEIDYDILVNGTRYPRTLKVNSFTAEDAFREWNEQCKTSNEFVEYFIKGSPRKIS